MDPASSDRLTLVTSVGPEALVALIVLAIGIAGVAIGAFMTRRGLIEALSLVGVFGFMILGALLTLAHLPTELTLSRNGIDLRFWGTGKTRPWTDVTAVEMRRDVLGGVWLRFTDKSSALSSIWPPRFGFYTGAQPLEPHQMMMRVDAWRVTPTQ